MPPQQPSSADLAKQFGGVDVSALAAQFGGSVVDEPQAVASHEQPSAKVGGTFGQEFNAAANPLPMVRALYNPMGFAQDAALGIVQQQVGEAKKAKEAFQTGHYGDAAMYGLSTAVPVIGPQVTHFGEMVKSGNLQGAAGQVAGIGLSAKVAPKIPGMVKAGAEAAPRVAAAILPESVATKAATVFPAVDAAMQARKAAKIGAGSTRLTADLTKAIPPSQAAPYTPSDVMRVSPYLAAEHASSPITTIDGLIDASQSAITQIEAKVSEFVDAHPADLIRSNPLAAARATLAHGVRGSDLEIGMRELADLGLDRPLTLQQADAIRLRLNQENAATLAKNNIDQFKARTTDPAFAAREAAADALREGIYDQLESRGVDAKSLRQDEGAIIKIRNAAQRQKFAAERPVAGTGSNTMTSRVLRRTLPVVGGAAGAATAGPLGAGVGVEAGLSLARRMASPNLSRNALIERAFANLEGTKGPSYPVMPPDAPVRGLLEAPPRASHVPDTSFVRGVPAAVQPTGASRMLPEPVRPIVSHVPDTSSVRGVPAPISPSNIRALPAHEGRPMPPNPHEFDARVIEARGVVVRDPKTGRFKRVYTTEGKQ